MLWCQPCAVIPLYMQREGSCYPNLSPLVALLLVAAQKSHLGPSVLLPQGSKGNGSPTTFLSMGSACNSEVQQSILIVILLMARMNTGDY